jgi:hypothetical protein
MFGASHGYRPCFFGTANSDARAILHHVGSHFRSSFQTLRADALMIRSDFILLFLGNGLPHCHFQLAWFSKTRITGLDTS